MGMRKFFQYLLPLGLIGLSIIVVVSLVAVAKGKRPERKDDGQPGGNGRCHPGRKNLA